MMEFLDVTILSVLQGVAEFLPISSSGHLVIGQSALGINAPGMRLDIFLHVGTVFAIFAYYRVQTWRLASGLFSRDAVRRRESPPASRAALTCRRRTPRARPQARNGK